jgi:ABC-2 type transport system ATP-binding protein
MDALRITNLTKHFGSTVAVNDVSFSVASGEVMGFLGPNGAGKSTTLRMALGLLRPDAGEVRVLGHPAGSSAARAATAYVPGETSLWGQLTGAETIELLGALHGSIDAVYRDSLIERFELDPTKRVRAYSKGNKQKVALVAAFATRADVILLDEPTSGLDPLMEQVFRQCVSDAVERGAAVLLSSHMLGEVDRLCTNVAMIKDGRLVDVANITTLRAAAGQLVVVTGDVGSLNNLEGVDEVGRDGNTTTIRVTGDMGALIQRLAEGRVTNLETRESTLEEIFLSFYDTATTR